ncbi:multifunctional CCA addition/repair protein [Stutzerimonas tarimensis]|uniref:CCA-adding enzyme n=1 Tax=Stutzerimonas tarimensis TaxID=1507735 RepID=A0ABV7TCS8_9GAMM
MQIYKVGGAVRDRLLGRPVTEVDWVVVGASAEEMARQGFRPVGSDFPVFLHPQTGEEYALARTERKSGRGYGGFTFFTSPEVTLEQDLLRRDLTINAMAEDEQGQVIDPYGGRHDLQARLLRHVSPAFAEDPLRVLRVARFAARYAGLGFTVAAQTCELMRGLAESGELQALTPERSWKEISRALMEPHPEVFVRTLHECGALGDVLPEVEALFSAGTGQQRLRVLEQCARHDQPLAVRWACLVQDPGAIDNERPESPTSPHLARIDALNQRCKPPRDCQELASLVGQYRVLAQTPESLSPAQLLALLQRFDVYRRPLRLEQFLAACEMEARAQGFASGSHPQGDYLRGAASVARGVTVQPLLAQGYKGAELGEALSREREKALAGYMKAP